MKKLLFFVAIASLVFLGSCEKDHDRVENAITINTSNFPTGTELLVSLVPSEQTDQYIPVDANVNERSLINLSSEQKSLLKPDAYLSVILFDNKGEYLTQNFFPFVPGEQILTLTEE